VESYDNGCYILIQKNLKKPEDLIADMNPIEIKSEIGKTNGNNSIDPNILKGIFGDNDEMFKEVLYDFLKPCRSEIREIQSGFEAKSAERVISASHKLKSAARSVGATELGELCSGLEQAGMSNNWDTINTDVPKLAGLMSQIEAYVAKL